MLRVTALNVYYVKEPIMTQIVSNYFYQTFKIDCVLDHNIGIEMKRKELTKTFMMI